MKSRLPLSLALVAGAALAGCTATKTLSVSAANPVEPINELGHQVLLSQGVNGVGVRLLTPRFSNRTEALPAFYIGVANGGARALGFSPADVAAYSGTAPVRLYTRAQLEERFREEADYLAAAAAAEEETRLIGFYERYQRQAMNATPGTNASELYRNYFLRPQPESVAHSDATNTLRHIGRWSDEQLNRLDRLLRPEKIPPGAAAGGTVKLHAEDIKTGQPLRLVVTAGGETHEFVFEVSG